MMDDIDIFLDYLNNSDIDSLEFCLRKTMKEKVDANWILAKNQTYNGYGHYCCAIGSIGPIEDNIQFIMPISFLTWMKPNYSINNDLVLKLKAIAFGFDDNIEFSNNFNHYEDFHNLGQRLWKYAEELQAKKQ